MALGDGCLLLEQLMCPLPAVSCEITACTIVLLAWVASYKPLLLLLLHNGFKEPCLAFVVLISWVASSYKALLLLLLHNRFEESCLAFVDCFFYLCMKFLLLLSL